MMKDALPCECVLQLSMLVLAAWVLCRASEDNGCPWRM